MEPLPNWDAAVAAAGMSLVYNAEDWISAGKGPFSADSEVQIPPPRPN
jgi:hypothetical protein